jgi:hypothetical protein
MDNNTSLLASVNSYLGSDIPIDDYGYEQLSSLNAALGLFESRSREWVQKQRARIMSRMHSLLLRDGGSSDVFEEIGTHLGVSSQTVQNVLSTQRRVIEAGVRVPDSVTFSHAAVVASLDTKEEKEAWLQSAADNEWSASDLAAEVKAKNNGISVAQAKMCPKVKSFSVWLTKNVDEVPPECENDLETIYNLISMWRKSVVKLPHDSKNTLQ